MVQALVPGCPGCLPGSQLGGVPASQPPAAVLMARHACGPRAYGLLKGRPLLPFPQPVFTFTPLRLHPQDWSLEDIGF